jgi:hypothetical protein
MQRNYNVHQLICHMVNIQEKKVFVINNLNLCMSEIE